MFTVSLDQEVAALRYARWKVQNNEPYICLHLGSYFVRYVSQEFSNTEIRANWGLIKEVEEFLDGAGTVENWLKAFSRTFTNQIRLAIIDTLLARRGVFK